LFSAHEATASCPKGKTHRKLRPSSPCLLRALLKSGETVFAKKHITHEKSEHVRIVVLPNPCCRSGTRVLRLIFKAWAARVKPC